MTAIPQNPGVPTGTVMWCAAPEPPVGWLLCDGRFVAVGDQPALFNAIGYTFGGDSETFAIPDLVGRFILGAGGVPGADPFLYGDGQNSLHRHGMFPETVHTHFVTDPGHSHPTSSGTHTHVTTSNHSHVMDTNHRHPMNWYSTGVLLATTCAQSVFATPFRGGAACDRNPEYDNFTYDKSKTGITAVGTNVTGTSVEIAFTGVTLANHLTDISLEFAETGITVDSQGLYGGPQPKNIAFLPIIRT